MEMAERIKERRIAMGFTQEELGNKLGLQKSAIAKYENGRVENIKRSTIANMATILECSPCYLMGWEENKNISLQNVPEIITYYEQLNDMGKDEATKRVMELTEIPRYIQKDIEPAQFHTIAAHFDGDEFTEDELEEISEFEEFVKNRKKNKYL